jgi:hypothetical protein
MYCQQHIITVLCVCTHISQCEDVVFSHADVCFDPLVKAKLPLQEPLFCNTDNVKRSFDEIRTPITIEVRTLGHLGVRLT